MTNPIEPDYYRAKSLSVIDFIEQFKLPFALGNVIKYVARDKHDRLEDLKKARWYLDHSIKQQEAGEAERAAFTDSGDPVYEYRLRSGELTDIKQAAQARDLAIALWEVQQIASRWDKHDDSLESAEKALQRIKEVACNIEIEIQ